MTSSNYSGGHKRKLYRNPDKGKICGVCSGVAEYFGFEVWVVRIIAVSMVLLGFGPIILAYFVLYFVLDPKPGTSERRCGKNSRFKDEYESLNDEEKPYRPSVKDVWRSGQVPGDMLEVIESKFSAIESKLQRMESYVTSNQFELEKEFSKMER